MSTLERLVLDALPVTVYTVDMEGRLTFMNRSWTRFAEHNGAPQLCDEGIVLGTSIWDSIGDAAVRDQMRAAMTQLREGRALSLSWEFPCNSPSEELVFLMQISPVYDAVTMIGYAFSTVDITPSHRSREVLIDTGMVLARTISVERALQEVTLQLRRTMSCERVAIALADDESQSLQLVHHSGYEAHELASIRAHLAPAWEQAVARNHVVTHMDDTGVEITAPMHAGESVTGAITLSATELVAPHRLEETQRVLATVAAETAAAIERARLVKRLEHKGRLEAIGEVSAGVAHELRNPLFGISSAAQLLRYRMRDDPIVDRNVGRILREVERLNGMVTSLLEYGRPSPIRLVHGNPEDVWDEVLENQRGLLESRSIHLQRSATTAATAANCRIDVQQLAQVFLNVLVNAVDAAPAESTISIHSVMQASGAWRCRVHNGGAPVPPDALPHVFDIFFSTKPEGTGIGLALCQRIIEEHGGTIGIESTADAGTTLTLTLPGS